MGLEFPDDVDGEYNYGFKWGPMVVERTAHLTSGYCLTVKGAKGHEVQIWVSSKGRSVRVWGKDGELK